MQLVYERCAGLDLHKKTVVACAITPDERGQRQKVLQTFSTMTPDLLRLRDWLTRLGVTQVAMESTGVFWKPVFNVLEGVFELRARQCPAYQSRARTQDRCQGCGMDC